MCNAVPLRRFVRTHIRDDDDDDDDCNWVRDLTIPMYLGLN